MTNSNFNPSVYKKDTPFYCITGKEWDQNKPLCEWMAVIHNYKDDIFEVFGFNQKDSPFSDEESQILMERLKNIKIHMSYSLIGAVKHRDFSTLDKKWRKVTDSSYTESEVPIKFHTPIPY
jgi:hypothetical protein